MPKIVIHRTALLLVAVLAMLPLQAIQAALGGAGAHGVHATGLAAHDAPAMSDMPACPMHQAGADEAAGGMHCSGGCKLCGACAGAVLPITQPVLSRGTDHPSPRAETGTLPHPSYALFRPPRH